MTATVICQYLQDAFWLCMLVLKCKKAFWLDLKQTERTVLQQCSSKKTALWSLSSWAAGLQAAQEPYLTSTLLMRSQRLIELANKTAQHGENVLFLILKRREEEKRMKSASRKNGCYTHGPIFPLSPLRCKNLDPPYLIQHRWGKI